MGLAVAIKNGVLNQVFRGTDYAAGVATHVSLHTADPGDNGANELTGGTYARQAATWAVAANGAMTLSGAATFTGLPTGTVTHFGAWSASSGGTYVGSGTTPSRALVNPDNYTLTTGTAITA